MEYDLCAQALRNARVIVPSPAAGILIYFTHLQSLETTLAQVFIIKNI